MEILDWDDPRHGSASTYGKLGCRCDLCAEAYRLAHRQWRANGLKALSEGRSKIRHGSTTAYQYGCRCEVCVNNQRERNALRTVLKKTKSRL